ncbi:MAG: APC family permease [Gemmatimonadetes bacterium]|nr:APC family permease [Gemmatimonadota bacterium]
MLKRTLTTTALVFVMFFTTSGGAYSMEGLVVAAGPGLALVMLLALPLVYSAPESLIIAELASAMPEEGGYYRWVRRAFGSFWGFQNGWITYLYSLVDMAIYPVLFNTYLSWFVPNMSAGAHWGVSLVLIWGATAINLSGALNVGRVSIAAGVFVLTGFAVLAVVALPQVTHAPWTPFVVPGSTVGAGLAVALSTALWNYIGWDNASTVQGEVVDASRAYPRALSFAVPLVTLSYFIPLLPTLAATNLGQWKEGAWPAVAVALGGRFGPFLAAWLAIGGMISAMALLNALLMTYSRVPHVLAVDGLLPRALAVTDARGTPRRAVVISAIAYSIFALLPFSRLVVADVLLYSLALILEFCALLALRRREPELRGVFRIPLGWGGVAAIATLPTLVLCVVVGLAVHDGELAMPSLIGSAVGVALGPLFYFIAKRSGRTTA